jgi:hypothetical protein
MSAGPSRHLQVPGINPYLQKSLQMGTGLPLQLHIPGTSPNSQNILQVGTGLPLHLQVPGKNPNSQTKGQRGGTAISRLVVSLVQVQVPGTMPFSQTIPHGGDLMNLGSASRLTVVGGSMPSIHSHSHCPLMVLNTGCFSAMHKISGQDLNGVAFGPRVVFDGVPGSSPGIH